jgi:hypothetical protein
MVHAKAPWLTMEDLQMLLVKSDYLSMQQAAHAFQAMPFETEFQKRD